MTEDRLPLADLLAKAGDGDFLRSVAEALVQLLMETDVEGVIGAGRHERSGERTTYRNGYRDRTLDTRLGSLQLRIPKLRQGSYFPPFLEPRKTSEKALVAVIQESWVGGVSTRRVDDLVQAMGLSGISKSTVSKLCKDIDDRVNAFLDRPLVGDWPYLWLDATYLKQREGGRIVSVAAIIAVAANTDGKREIVGLHIGPSEAETFWATFLKSLVRRGLRGVKLVISDAHEGLKAAIRRVMGASWQRCRVHWMRNAQSYVGRAQQSMVSAALRQAFIQPDRASASQTLRHTADQLRGKWPKLASFIDEGETDVLAHMDFPVQHRSKIHSTNPVERVNKEVKRRADVVGSLSAQAKEALGRGATIAGTSITTGDGGMTQEERQSSQTLVYQYLPSRYGMNPDDLRAADAIEIVIGQGAKPGGGGMLLGQKITPRVAAMRTLPPGIDQRSASRHPDWTGPDDLEIKILELREVTDWQKPIYVKVGASRPYYDTALAAKAGADVVVLDGMQGGTAATQTVFIENVGLPILAAIRPAVQALQDLGLHRTVQLVVSGGIRNGADVAKALALGADAVSIGTAALAALGDNDPAFEAEYAALGTHAGAYDAWHEGRDPRRHHTTVMPKPFPELTVRAATRTSRSGATARTSSRETTGSACPRWRTTSSEGSWRMLRRSARSRIPP